MSAGQSTLKKSNNKTVHNGVISLVSALALTAAMIFAMMALGILPISNQPVIEGSTGILPMAATGYILGGLLIRLPSRWLWIIGTLANGSVTLFFFHLYQGSPDVLFSAGVLGSMTALLLLEFGLVFLIAVSLPRFRRTKRVERFALVDPVS